jgi:hypothetical protein
MVRLGGSNKTLPNLIKLKINLIYIEKVVEHRAIRSDVERETAQDFKLRFVKNFYKYNEVSNQ